MKFVSLGSFCSVRGNIDLYSNQDKSETLFFDWLWGRYEGLIFFIESKEFEEFELTKDNLQIVGSNPPYCSVYLKDLYSIHDLPLEYTDQDIHNFLSKYRRRYNRTKKLLKSEPLHFIYREMKTISEEQKFHLFELLKMENSKHKLSVIGTTDGPNRININKFKTQFEGQPSWKEEQIDWHTIFLHLRSIRL